MSKPLYNLWQHTAPNQLQAQALQGSHQADLTIIGGGFTGCSAALHAAQHGASVCLLEANQIGYGGSGRNVGLVNAGLWLPPETIAQQLGELAAAHLTTMLGTAPELVFQLIHQYEIECEAVRNGTLHCAHATSGVVDLQDRYRQLKALGAPVSLLDAEQTTQRTGSHAFQGALHDARAGTIQPLAYCQGLAHAAQQLGAKLYEQSPVQQVTRVGNDWRVQTAQGQVLSKALLLATNAYHQTINELPSPETIPVYYFQLATKPLHVKALKSILPNREGCWDTATVMSSFRLDQAGRLLIGAIGSLEHAGKTIHERWAQRKLTELYPELADQSLEFAWCGRIAMTSDHVPKILQLGENAYAVFGYSGRGIGPGTLFGKTLGEFLIAKTDQASLPLQPIAHYHESLSTAKQVYYEMGASLTHFVSAR